MIAVVLRGLLHLVCRLLLLLLLLLRVLKMMRMEMILADLLYYGCLWCHLQLSTGRHLEGRKKEEQR